MERCLKRCNKIKKTTEGRRQSIFQHSVWELASTFVRWRLSLHRCPRSGIPLCRSPALHFITVHVFVAVMLRPVWPTLTEVRKLQGPNCCVLWTGVCVAFCNLHTTNSSSVEVLCRVKWFGSKNSIQFVYAGAWALMTGLWALLVLFLEAWCSSQDVYTRSRSS